MLPLMKRLACKKRHAQRGQLLPLVALGVLALFGMATLAIDVGYYRYQQRLEQSAADAAALAGGIQLIYTSANMVAAGQAASAQNGFTDDAGVTTTVTINNPPATGPNTTNARAVEAIVTRKQPIFFGGVLGAGPSQSITARAVALPNSTAAGCLTTLSTSSGITMHGTGSVIVAPGCGILSNDDISVTGNGSVTASYIGSVAGSIVPCTGCIAPSGTIAPVGNPCISFTGCAYLYLNGAPSMTSYTTATWTTGAMPAGKYTNSTGVTISGGTLNGFYEFDNGVTITGSVTGTNLTIYNLVNPISIKLSGSGSTSLAAPTTGNYSGLLIYQPLGVSGQITLNGAASTDAWTGLVFTPGATMKTDGSEPTFSSLVLGSMTNDGHDITLTGTGPNSTYTNHYDLAE
jgi:Flp pilus assembly protein TadG